MSGWRIHGFEELHELGTGAYMAPEQWHGHAATPASDVYAATCVFFECVTGRPPYASGETTMLRRMHESAPVPAEAVPEALRTLVAHGMAKDPARRPPSAQEFGALLERVATQAYGPGWERRGWIALGAATAVLAAAFPAAALGMTGSSVLGHGAVHLAGKVGAKGFLGKATGVKIGAGLATAAVAATTIYLVWPTPQQVGGTSTGSLHLYLTQPGKIIPYRTPTAADSPVMDFTFTVSPSRIRQGLAARVGVHAVVETPGGPDKRATSPRCYDRDRARLTRSYDYLLVSGSQNEQANYSSFYPTVGEQHRLPTTKPINLVASKPVLKTYDHYDANRCVDVEHTDWTLTFAIPRDDRLRPGKYVLSPIGPPRLNDIQVGPTEKKRVSINPESAGAQAQGRLPVVTILR
jgi:hypothetical protein